MSRLDDQYGYMDLDDFEELLPDKPRDEKWELIGGRVVKMMPRLHGTLQAQGKVFRLVHATGCNRPVRAHAARSDPVERSDRAR